MSRTSIEWCARPGTFPESWNWITGCNKVSQGCKNCYAEIMHRRLQYMYPDKYDHDFLTGAHVHEDLLTLPLSWKKPRTVFVNSMSDVFHKNVALHFIYRAFHTMYKCPQHTFIILTKRAERLHEVNDIWFHLKRNYPSGIFPCKNIWLLVSTEDQETANERIPLLLKVEAAVRGISAEPLLGNIDLSKWLPKNEGDGVSWGDGSDYGDWVEASHRKPLLNWLIAGGESGHQARPMHPNWARSLRDQCQAAGIPFFFKQWGEYYPNALTDGKKPSVFVDSKTLMAKIGKKKSGRLLDGRTWNEFPEYLTTLAGAL